MKIGFCNIYSFRPHVHHLMYLANLMSNAGHEVFFLTCDSSVEKCYARLIKGTSKLKECSRCILGGVRSFPVENITSISSSANKRLLSREELDKISLSSSCTLHRIECDTEWNDSEVMETRASLHTSIQKAYDSALNWIETNALESVICFNGRMELTRAICLACETAQINFVTHERTWFGDGIRLIPNDSCLNLYHTRSMILKFREKPLTFDQASLAGKLIAQRFLQKNNLEWRVYNRNPEPTKWPIPEKGKKILVLPSSKNEFAGNDEWHTSWQSNTQALEDFFDAFEFDFDQVVIRFHPNWSETIGQVDGERSRKHYMDWAKKNQVHYIDSGEKASTYNLIEEADLVVLNGGSSSVEAGILGKQVVCLGPSDYDSAGFLRVFKSKDEMLTLESKVDLDKNEIIKKTLRYVYLRAKRLPQYTDFVIARSTTLYDYYEGGEASKLEDLLLKGELEADDQTYSESPDGEERVLSLVLKKEWDALVGFQNQTEDKVKLENERRVLFKWVDTFREMMPIGDR